MPPIFLTAAEVAERRQETPFRLVDARPFEAYVSAHAEGAAPLPAATLNPVVGGVRTIVAPGALARTLRHAGADAAPLVVYGSRGSPDAAHVAWTLRAHGHPATYVLDGSLDDLVGAGLDVARGHDTPESPVHPFEPAPTRRRIEADELANRLDDPDLYLLDTRREDEVTGRTRAAPRGGHVPGAVHLDWRDALAPDGRLQPRDRLEALFAEPLAAPEVATYCQSGVRAAHTALLLEHLGHARVRMYLSSWGEWGGRPDTPVATGPARRPGVVPR